MCSVHAWPLRWELPPAPTSACALFGCGLYSSVTLTVVNVRLERGRPLVPHGHAAGRGGENVTTKVARTSRPARMDTYADASGPMVASLRSTARKRAAMSRG